MNKELQLLNSIQENASGGALLSETGRPKFLEFLSTCVKQIEQSRSKVEERMQADQAEATTLEEQMERLLDNQRQYFRAVKDFQEACTANESLRSGVGR